MNGLDPRAVWPGWETVRLIGRGSFGAVYEIERDIFGEKEKAALKLITIPQSGSDIDQLLDEGYDEASIGSVFQEHLRSILKEYSLMRKLSSSPNVVNCEDVRYLEHDDGMGWDILIKMELLSSLPKALGKEVTEEQVLQVGMDLSRALVLCRKHDIIHRDIKPANIFVSENGDYKLGDFGIAKTVERTTGGTKIGTYEYMAPEVYNNQPYGHAADLCSLGLVLYWMLNERRLPFLPLPPQLPTAAQKEQARLHRMRGEPIPAPLHGSEELKRIVLTVCDFDPKNRYAGAEELLQDLEDLQASIRLDKRLPSAQERDRQSRPAPQPVSAPTLTPTPPQPAPEPAPKPQPAPEPASAPQPAPGPTPAPQPAPQPVPGPEIYAYRGFRRMARDVYWKLDQGTLIVEGSGPMPNYLDDFRSPPPWADARKSITSLRVGNGITSIGDWSFHGCSSLRTVSLPAGLLRVGDRAFFNCDSLETVQLPSGLNSIGNSAFYHCSRLSSVNFPEGLGSIGDYAFYFCFKLQTAALPAGLGSIGDYAFYYCSGMGSLSLPASLGSIGSFAFSHCDRLTQVYFDGSPEQWRELSLSKGNEMLWEAARRFWS